jgi:hypothetical protein
VEVKAPLPVPKRPPSSDGVPWLRDDGAGGRGEVGVELGEPLRDRAGLAVADRAAASTGARPPIVPVTKTSDALYSCGSV